MADNPNLIEESEVPKKWKPVDPANTILEQPAAAPLPNDMPPYFAASLAPTLQHDSSFVGTQVGTPRIPKYSLMPFGNQLNPFTNAAAQSTAVKVVEATPATPSTGGGGITSIELDIPTIFTPTTQTSTASSTVLAFSLATEPPGTFFSVPSGSLASVETFGTYAVATGAGTAGGSITLTPTSATSWGIFACAQSNTGIVTPSGFTVFSGNNALFGSFYKGFTGTTPVTVTEGPLTANNGLGGAFVIFSGSVPTPVQQTSIATFGTNMVKAFTSSNTAGNTIIVIVTGLNSANGPFGFTVTDSAGNQYTTVAYVQQAGGPWFQTILIAIANNIAGSANTVTAAVTAAPGAGNGTLMQIVEYAPFAAAPSVPVFKPIVPSDIPPINLGSAGNGGIFGTLKIDNGGTSANLKATGGVSQFLSQAAAGAAITVVQPDFGDLAGLNKALKYNNLTLVAAGLPSEIAQVDLTNQSAAIASTNVIASIPTTAQYRLNWNAKVTTVDGASSTLGALTITYTDADNTVQTITAAAQSNAGIIETSDTGNLTTTVLLGLPMMLNARSATAVKYAMAYASGTPGTMKYNLHIKLEAM